MIKKKRKNGFIRQNKDTINEYVGFRKKNQDEGKKHNNYFKTLVDQTRPKKNDNVKTL